MKDREFVANLIDRAKAAKCSALVLTLDLQILGQRHKDLRNGLSAPPKWTVHHGIQLATKPFWCLDILRTKRRSEEHTSELQSLMRISYAVFCLKKKNNNKHITNL